jgi:pimeloyl-ACP methyl ester carboxylesterase
MKAAAWRAAVVIGVLGIVAIVAVVGARPRRPQDEAIARGPRPYTETEVSFENAPAQVKLAGTFSVPNGKGPFPAVLLIAAAGPVTRDEDAAGHLVFVVLADHLLRQGIAVLRYDKRGVGKSTGDFGSARFDDLVADAVTAFRYLETRPEVDPRKVGTLGHSEGGSIAPAVASIDPDVAFVVAMAGSGLTGQFRITENRAFVAQENGATAEQVAKIRGLCRQIFATVAATPDDALASSRINALIDAAVAANVMTPQYAAENRQLLSPKFVREELSDDPLIYLKKVRVPVLAIVGSLDRTVPAEPYVAAMRPVLATIPGSSVQVLPRLNHVLQTAATGSPKEFATIEESIAPLALKTVGDWIVQQVKSPQR